MCFKMLKIITYKQIQFSKNVRSFANLTHSILRKWLQNNLKNNCLLYWFEKIMPHNWNRDYNLYYLWKLFYWRHGQYYSKSQTMFILNKHILIIIIFLFKIKILLIIYSSEMYFLYIFSIIINELKTWFSFNQLFEDW
jgi:hypothetical protein